MSVEILGLGHITFYDGVITNDEVLELFKRMSDHEDFNNVTRNGMRAIFFEMGGNHNIDYTEIEKIKQELIDKKGLFQLIITEWMECSEGGIYYDSTEEGDKNGG